MVFAIIIIIIILYFLNNRADVFGGSQKIIDEYKMNFNPVLRYENILTGKYENYQFKFDRYTNVDQVKQIAKYGSKPEIARLIQLLCKFINIPVFRVCGLLDKSDSEIIEILNKNNKKKMYATKNTNKTKKTIEIEIETNIKMYMLCKKIKKAKSWSVYKEITNYLDYGCNNGYNTKAFGHVLGAKNIYGCDIGKFDIPGVIFNKINDGEPLPYPDNYFEIISIVHVFHHVSDVNFLIKEFRRILKPHGIIMFMDHLIFNDMDSMLVDIEHWLWNTANGGKPEEGDFRVKHYVSYTNIDDAFSKQKFACINANIMYYGFNEEPEPTKTMYMYFIKTDKDLKFIGDGSTYLYNDRLAYEQLTGIPANTKI